MNYRLDNVPLGFQYKIVDYCPDHTSVDINTKCITPTAIEEIIPVSSRDGEKLFRNKYCAYCHGYMNIVMWGLYISEDCNNLMEQSFQSVEERNSYILEHCHVKTFPPSSDYIQKVACTIGKVSTCRSTNSTILQKYQARCLQDSKVWDNELYQHRVRHVDLLFNNVYCFLCSDFVSTSAIENDQCTTMQWKRIRGTNVVSLVYMISLTHEHDTVNVDTKSTCSVNAIFDKFQVQPSYIL